MAGITHQRRNGQIARIYKSKFVADSRGSKVRIVDNDSPPHVVRVWAIPQRSQRAEVPGQQDIDVVRFGTTSDLSSVDSWSQIEYMGHRYDVVVPPAYHHGTRHTRHWSIDCRKRPNG